MIDQNRQDITPSGIQSVTPEEARRMICVFSDTSTCVADRCMAWRKDYSYIRKTMPRSPGFPPAPLSNLKIENGKGYCGMVTHKGD